MGTRADFYVGRGRNAEWLGSIAWDGYPSAISSEIHETAGVKAWPPSEDLWRRVVSAFLTSREDGSKPDDGWPWPWDDSRTTDYAYAFDDGKVWVSSFGSGWRYATDSWDDDEEDDRPPAEFPCMSDRKRVTFGRRSGVIIVGSAP